MTLLQDMGGSSWEGSVTDVCRQCVTYVFRTFCYLCPATVHRILGLVGPSVCALEERTEMVDLPRVIEIVRDDDLDERSSRKGIAPVCWTRLVKLGVIGEGGDGGQPSPMALLEPGQELFVGSGSSAARRDEGRNISP